MTITLSSAPRIQSRFSQRLGNLHGPLAVFLVGVVGCSALPFGSNRPFFWAFWPTVLGIIAVVYALIHLAKRSDFRVQVGSMKSLALPYLAICAVLVLQLAPLGGLYWGDGIATQTGIRLHPPLISVTPGETILMLLRWIAYGLMFFLVLQVAFSEQRRLRMLQAMAAVITVHALVGILSYYQWGNTILGLQKWAYLDSMTGTFVNRNSFATFIALGLTLTTGLALHTIPSRHGPGRLVEVATYGLAMIFLVGALLGSNSRMGLLVGTLGPLATMASHLILARSRRQVLWAIPVFVVAVALAASVYGTGVWTRFFEVEASGQDRVDLYAQVWRMILAAPWLGYGGGSFGQAYQIVHQPPVHTALVWERAHNTYLTLWSELGFIAGSLPLLLVAAVTTITLRAIKRADRIDPAQPIWFGAVIVVSLHSLVDFSFEIFAVALTLAMLGALATAASLPKSKRNAGRSAGQSPET